MGRLQDQLDAQLKAAHNLIRVEHVGFSRQKAAETVLAMLPDYILDVVIKLRRSELSQVGQLETRFHYTRATALWALGKKDASRAEHDKIKTSFNGVEKEIYDSHTG